MAGNIIHQGFQDNQTTRHFYANFLKEIISAIKETCVIMLTGPMNFNNRIFLILTRWHLELTLGYMEGILNNSRCLMPISMVCSSHKWWWWNPKYWENGSNNPSTSHQYRWLSLSQYLNSQCEFKSRFKSWIRMVAKALQCKLLTLPNLTSQIPMSLRTYRQRYSTPHKEVEFRKVSRCFNSFNLREESTSSIIALKDMLSHHNMRLLKQLWLPHSYLLNKLRRARKMQGRTECYW